MIDAAMLHFWQHGYEASSLGDLVAATGVSRQGIYADAGSKQALYLASFERYRDTVVTPAFSAVEKDSAGLSDIRAFMETQICLAEKDGLPSKGCLISNAMTETAPHDDAVQTCVQAHLDRLETGIAKALANDAPRVPEAEITVLASMIVTAIQGLWSMARHVTNAAPLRQQADALIDLVRIRIAA